LSVFERGLNAEIIFEEIWKVEGASKVSTHSLVCLRKCKVYLKHTAVLSKTDFKSRISVLFWILLFLLRMILPMDTRGRGKEISSTCKRSKQ